jgi:hypothetical protein
MYATENSVIHIDRSEKSVIIGPHDLRGWRHFPSQTCVGLASRLGFFLTVYIDEIFLKASYHSFLQPLIMNYSGAV